LEKAGMINYVTINHHDAHLGLDLRNVDIAIIDIGDPWTLVNLVRDALKGSGAFAAICPTMNQLEKTVTELKQNAYIDVDCVEIMIRNIEAREGMTRPSTRMIGHTTYLVFARKAIRSDEEKVLITNRIN
jgi:tRNA (adenine57-N1/adenine58-N1)-methyltransferase